MLKDLELCESIAIDSLTGETVSRSVYLKSGVRAIHIGINTLVKINDFLRSKGIRVNSDD